MRQEEPDLVFTRSIKMVRRDSAESKACSVTGLYDPAGYKTVEECVLRFVCSDRSFERAGHNWQDSLTELRRELEAEGWFLYCYAATENCWSSGLNLEMGKGQRGYRWTLGQTPGPEDLVDLLDSESGLTVRTIAEQEAFQQVCFDQIRRGLIKP